VSELILLKAHQCSIQCHSRRFTLENTGQKTY